MSTTTHEQEEARRRARIETLAWHRLARLTKNEENAR